MSLDERFWSKVDKTDSCWNWTAGKKTNGYGQFWENRENKYSHRVSYQYHRGKIPNGLQIDHLCRNRACVNPSHLEVVTPKENILRGIGLAAENSRKTHCKRGHEFNEENTLTVKTKGGQERWCRICKRKRELQYYHFTNESLRVFVQETKK